MSTRGIFICYRHADAQGEAGRIDDRLRPRYGSEQVFRDVYSSSPGVGFPEYLVKAVNGCAVVIVVIGKHWLQSLLRRPDGTDDWLQLEIRTALSSPSVTVIPVLVQGAAMPRPEQLPADIRRIAAIKAHEISDSRWEYDMSRLLQVVDGLVPPSPVLAGGAPGVTPRAGWTRAAAAATLIGLIVFMCGLGVGLTLATTHVLGVGSSGNPPPDGPPHEGPPPGEPPDGPPMGAMWLRSVANDECIQLGSGPTASDVVQGACTAGSTDDQWRLVDVGRDLWEIMPANGSGCLAIKGGSSEPGAPVVLAACAGAPFQRWLLEESPEREWHVVATHSQECLDITRDGHVVQSRCATASNSQLWRLQPMTPDGAPHEGRPPPR